MSEIIFKAIGQVRTRMSETEIRGESKDVEAELEIFPEFEAALERTRRLFASLCSRLLS